MDPDNMLGIPLFCQTFGSIGVRPWLAYHAAFWLFPAGWEIFPLCQASIPHISYFIVFTFAR